MEDIIIKEEPKRYEVSFVQKEENAGEIRMLIEKHGGVVLNEIPIVKIRLSYPIQKETQGFFGIIDCTFMPESIEKFSADAKLNKNILRCFVTIPQKGNGSDSRSSEEREKFPRKKRGSASPKPKTPFSPVLTNEALQEKLEEILQ